MRSCPNSGIGIQGNRRQNPRESLDWPWIHLKFSVKTCSHPVKTPWAVTVNYSTPAYILCSASDQWGICNSKTTKLNKYRSACKACVDSNMAAYKLNEATVSPNHFTVFPKKSHRSPRLTAAILYTLIYFSSIYFYIKTIVASLHCLFNILPCKADITS